jgi:hypothetical protein
MAVDLSSLTPPRQTQRVALDATADNLTEVTFPRWARTVTLTFKKSDGTDDSGFVAFSGTDGASKGNDWFPIASGGAYSYEVTAPDDTSKIYCSASTASAYAHFMFERH